MKRIALVIGTMLAAFALLTVTAAPAQASHNNCVYSGGAWICQGLPPAPAPAPTPNTSNCVFSGGGWICQGYVPQRPTATKTIEQRAAQKAMVAEMARYWIAQRKAARQAALDARR